jgi:hypothetical protein
MPTSGGTPAPLYQFPVNNEEWVISALMVGTPSGIVMSDVNTSLTTGMSTYDMGVEALAGGAPTVLYSVTVANASTAPMVKSGGGVAVVGSNVLFITQASGGSEVFLQSAPLAGGTPTQVADLKPWSAGFLAADANGMYVDQSIASDTPGIYAVSASGTPTLFQAAMVSSVDTGNPRELTLDAKNVYWVAGGFNGGQANVHAKAR